MLITQSTHTSLVRISLDHTAWCCYGNLATRQTAGCWLPWWPWKILIKDLAISSFFFLFSVVSFFFFSPLQPWALHSCVCVPSWIWSHKERMSWPVRIRIRIVLFFYFCLYFHSVRLVHQKTWQNTDIAKIISAKYSHKLRRRIIESKTTWTNNITNETVLDL